MKYKQCGARGKEGKNREAEKRIAIEGGVEKGKTIRIIMSESLATTNEERKK